MSLPGGPPEHGWENANHLEGITHTIDQFGRQPDFQARFAAQYYSMAEAVDRSPATSSMQMTRNNLIQPPVTAVSLPELSSGGRSRTESSICTDDASRVRGYNSDILEPNEEGALSQDVPEHRPTVQLPCCFSFLRCSYWSSDMDEWYTHCSSHFHGQPPPTRVQCPYCDIPFRQGSDAWEARMHHIADHHIQSGAALGQPRPDSQLFSYLWEQRLITDAQLQELRVHHYLSNAPSYYTVTQGSSVDDRRRPESQRERRRGDRRADRRVLPWGR